MEVCTRRSEKTQLLLKAVGEAFDSQICALKSEGSSLGCGKSEGLQIQVPSTPGGMSTLVKIGNM